MEAQEGSKVVLLLGGGHANVQVLRELSDKLPSSCTLALVSEYDYSFYSGMLPGFISHAYNQEEISINLSLLCKFTQTRFVEKRGKRLDAENQLLVMEDDEELRYDILVVNIGSKTLGTESIPGVNEFSLKTRPIINLITEIEQKEEEFSAHPEKFNRVTIVGGGAAGIELVFALKKRWEEKLGKTLEFTQIVKSPKFAINSQSACGKVLHLYKDLDVKVLFDHSVKQVTRNEVILDDGQIIPSDLTVWATGAEPHAFHSRTTLQKDDSGFFLCNHFMQSVSHSEIFVAGDCASIKNSRVPKAGVYSVRQGPIIAENVLRLLKGKTLKKYVPQNDFLALLNTADGRAIATKWGKSIYGTSMWSIKNKIDSDFMKKFDGKLLMKNAKSKCL
mmetsp:Transcript_819/g.856  ORF Transcript_819/g.856 Transcript_819/m.856 type:complete len:390 (-) Transcript_819:90-1259(-)